MDYPKIYIPIEMTYYLTEDSIMNNVNNIEHDVCWIIESD